MRQHPVAVMGRVEESLVVCEQCAMPHRWLALSRHEVARCSRCEAIIGRGHRRTLVTTLALTVTAAAAYIVAMAEPLLSVGLRGAVESSTLPGSIVDVWEKGQPIIAGVAALTALVAPALFIVLRLYVLAPLALGHRPAGFAWCVRLLHQVARWSMVEVFTLGVLLSLVRLAGLADAAPGPGLFAFGALTLLFAAIEAAGLKHLWWRVP